ncbi:hypothetical protein GCM10027051_08480 [Niabella terrae]
MSKKTSKLESFIESHKEAFDEFEPSEALWHRIERALPEPKEQKGRVVSVRRLWQVAAAAAVILGGIFLIYRMNPSSSNPGAELTSQINDSAKQPDPILPKEPESTIVAVTVDTPVQELAEGGRRQQPTVVDPRPQISQEELYHYSRLIEIKQSQMEALKKSEPLLYKEFAADMEMLETSYGALKHQLDEGVNNEKILEAMIGNLKMQSELLNRQLEILKQVKNEKQNNEKSFKNL